MTSRADSLYGMRIVKDYNGQNTEEHPLFNGFEGIVVWITWDTGEWEILETWSKEGRYFTKTIGHVNDDEILDNEWDGEAVASFIKDEIKKVCDKDLNYAIDEVVASIIQVCDQKR